MIKKRIFIYFLFTVYCLLSTVYLGYAKEITILYTGETHAMLYPCNCPKEADGGLARRATLIKEIRKKDPKVLVLDSGGFFAGGLMDEYTQNTQLDSERSIVNLKALELMQYDALTIGDDEFNFGRDFFEDNIKKTKLTFLSCNIPSAKPYLIKEISATKIGIIGVTSFSANQKVTDLKIIEPKMAVRQTVEQLKKQGVNIIILLSHLGESEDIQLIKEISGIDIVIVGHSRSNEKSFSKIDSTLVLRPAWQGRKLGKLSLTLKDNRIADYKVEEIRLSDKVRDDPAIVSILPRCFSDANCKNKDLTARCQNPGSLSSACVFDKAGKVPLLIIAPKVCITCDTERIIEFLKARFPGLIVSYLYYPSSKAEKLIQDFGLKNLPVYLLGKDAEKEKGFDSFKENLEIKDKFYMLKPQFSGISYFLGRKKIKEKLDLFISLYDKNASGVLDAVKEFNPTVHFLAVQQQDNFNAQTGNLEVEEYLRSVCVQKYYPQIFWDYLGCRLRHINSSWWEDCLPAGQAGLGKLNSEEIKDCARGEEGRTLLKDNISLNKELEIMFGPTYLLDNLEVFSSQVSPTKEQLRKIIRR